MPHSAQPINVSRLNVARSFLGIFVAFLFLLIAVAAAHYYTEYKTGRLTREASEALNVELSRQMIVADIATVVSDLLVLAELVENNSADPQADWDATTGNLQQIFSFFSHNKGVYDQVRYLDENGNEVIRVNYQDGKAHPVPLHALQNKAHRYYFREAAHLGRGQIYVSPLDLNMESGHLQEPYKPVMRFATPVFDLLGRHRGIVVLNYMGEHLIRHFKQAAVNIADHVQLVNNEGYWLSSIHPEEEWGFMFGNEQRFDLRYPEAWEEMTGKGSGQVLTPAGLFSYSSVNPISVAQHAADPTYDLSRLSPKGGGSGYHWKIISHIPLQALAPLPGQFVSQHAPLYGGMLLLLMLVAYLLARSHSRHQWAEAQSQYESHFRRTLEDIQLAAVSVDESGQVGFCNDYFCRLCGWDRNEILDRNWIDTFVPQEQRETIREMLGLLRNPESFPARYEAEVVTHDGGRRLIAWNNTLSYNRKDGLWGVTSIGEDITDKRHNEEQVRKLSQAMEQSPSIVVITNRRGLIEYVNPKFTEVTGYPPEEVIGRNPRIMKSGETSPGEYRELWETIIGGGEWRGEFHNRRKNGELYWEAASISAIRDNSGQITHFLAVKEDITQRKQLEETIEERNRELARNQALAAMGSMSSMIAHDLRNPLSSVKMGLQIFNKKLGSTDEESRELCQIGLEQIHYMENILSDMLTFSRPEAMNMEWTGIDRLLSTTFGMLHKRLDDSGIELHYECAGGLPTFPGDINKLRQLFSNLIMNAAQAVETNPVGERILDVDARLYMDDRGTFIQVRICDNGYGIGDASQAQLFEPFFTTRAKGTGLGLAIVRQIVDQHRGRIELVARQERGTCAIVRLPTTPETKNGNSGATTRNDNVKAL